MIWWCQVHETANRPNTLGCWIGYDLWEESGKRGDPNCRLVSMRLIPDKEETMDRIIEALRQATLGNINAGFKEDRFPLIAARVYAVLDGETP